MNNFLTALLSILGTIAVAIPSVIAIIKKIQDKLKTEHEEEVQALVEVARTMNKGNLIEDSGDTVVEKSSGSLQRHYNDRNLYKESTDCKQACDKAYKRIKWE